MVACIARYHRRALPSQTHPGYATLTREDRATVSKLAALLRVADALDRDSQRIGLARVELRDDELLLTPDRDQDLALERLALRQKADLFEEVYGRKVVLNRSATHDHHRTAAGPDGRKAPGKAGSAGAEGAPALDAPGNFIDRELSWLAFNQRCCTRGSTSRTRCSSA
jgi:hypothetical protein